MQIEFTFNVHLNGRIDHHLHVASVGELVASINHLGDAIMALGQDIIDLTKKLDTATNLVAAELAFLRSQVKNSMTDEEVATIQASMKTLEDRLTALGTDPNNPVPAPLLSAIKRKP